jgi:hypothetical protein
MRRHCHRGRRRASSPARRPTRTRSAQSGHSCSTIHARSSTGSRACASCSGVRETRKSVWQMPSSMRDGSGPRSASLPTAAICSSPSGRTRVSTRSRTFLHEQEQHRPARRKRPICPSAAPPERGLCPRGRLTNKETLGAARPTPAPRTSERRPRSRGGGAGGNQGFPRDAVGVPGFEPGTSPTRTERATRLRHTPRQTTR